MPAQPPTTLRAKCNYVVALYFVRPPGPAALDSLRRHVESTGFQLITDRAQRTSDAMQTVWFVEPPLEAVPPPQTDEELAHCSRGFGSSELKQLRSIVAVNLLVFTHPGGDADARLRQADQLAYDVARDTGAVIFDGETRELFSLTAWQDLRLAGWRDDAPLASSHVTVHTYKRPGGYRSVSLGMVKLGLPDVALNDFDGIELPRVDRLMKLALQCLIAHPTLSSALELDLDAADGKQVAVPMAWVTPEPGDAASRLLELAFAGEQPSRAHQIDQLLTRIEPAAEQIVSTRADDVEVADAVAQVRTKLAALKPRFERGLGKGDHLRVKARFDGGGEIELMWIEVFAWSGDTLRGALRDHPRFVPDLVAGQTISVLQHELVDYALIGSDQEPLEGPFLDEILRKRAVAKQR